LCKITHDSFEKGFLEKFDPLIDKDLDNSTFSTDTISSQLFRISKYHTQLSSTLYFRKRKLEKVKSLLTASVMQISEIADAVGINSPRT
jgi:AraC-like DNA-binding protein